MTEQRRVVARVLSSASDHPDVEELHRRCCALDPHISIATVYRTVRLFEESGILTTTFATAGPATRRPERPITTTSST
jgi:Fe2+ or Zn2+ uptake regulation protein